MKFESKIQLVASAVAMLATTSITADAGEWYGSISGNAGIRSKSENTGEFTGDFTTGAGTLIPAGRVYPDGTAITSDTDFKSGWGVVGAIGHDYGNGFRTELEFSFRRNSVKTHENVVVNDPVLGSTLIDAEDAGLLITGSGNLGSSVGATLGAADGRGRTFALMLNGYWDVPTDVGVKPYIGGGIGLARAKHRFMPSALDFASDSDTALAYQAMAGIAFPLNKRTELFAGYRYFETAKNATDLTLIPARLRIENRIHSLDFGIRFRFGS